MNKVIKSFLVIILALGLWQLAYFIFQIQNPLLPAPSKIGQAFLKLFASEVIFFHILNSLQRVLVGFGLASIAGVFLGLVLGYYKRAGEYIRPLVEILRPLPPIAWIPIAILFFGLGNSSAYFIIFLGAFFPIFTNAYFGAESLPQVYKDISASFELSRLIFFKEILFKYALPYIFSGLKIGLGMAWICVIAAEMIGAQSGLGYFIQINRLLLQTDKMLAGMILIGLIGLILNILIESLEKRIIKWKN